MQQPELSGDERRILAEFWGTMAEPSPDYYPRKEGELGPQGLPLITEATLDILLQRFNLDGSYEEGQSFHGPDKVAHPHKERLVVAQGVYHDLGLIEESGGKDSGFLEALGSWVEKSFVDQDNRDSAAVGAAVVLSAYYEQVDDLYELIEGVPGSVWGEVFTKMAVNPADAKSMIKRNKKAQKIPLHQPNLRTFFDRFDTYIYSPEESNSTRRGAEGMYGALESMWDQYIKPQIPIPLSQEVEHIVDPRTPILFRTDS